MPAAPRTARHSSVVQTGQQDTWSWKQLVRTDLIFNSLRLFLTQVLVNVLCIHNSDNGVQFQVLLQPLVDEERLCDRCWVGQPCSLYDDVVKLGTPLEQLVEDAN